MKELEIRRKDRQMDEKFALKVVDDCPFATISMYDDEPYCVVISPVRKDNSIYFHCAKSGRKIDILKKNPRVCISFVSEAKAIYVSSFTTLFKSAIFYGNAVFVEDRDEKIDALRLLCEKYLPDKMENFDKSIQRSLERTQIIRIDMESFSAKAKLNG